MVRSKSGLTEEPDSTDLWMICRKPDYGSASDFPNPKKLYSSLASARHDVEDLIRRTGKDFYLLKVIAVARPASPPIEWIDVP